MTIIIIAMINLQERKTILAFTANAGFQSSNKFGSGPQSNIITIIIFLENHTDTKHILTLFSNNVGLYYSFSMSVVVVWSDNRCYFDVLRL